MPEEILAIIIVSIASFTAISILKMILSHREKTMGVDSKQQVGGSSLTTSELERMLHRAVRKATDPLVDRLEEIEDRINTPALPAAGERIDLDAVLEESEPAMQPRGERSRQR